MILVAVTAIWTVVLVRFRDFYDMNLPSSFIELDGDGYAAVSELVTSMPDWQPVFVRALEQGIKLRRRDRSFLSAQFFKLKEEKQKAVSICWILDLKTSSEHVESENANGGRASGLL